MTTIGIPCALPPAVALRVIDDLGESAHRLDRRHGGAWASFEQLARTATFAGREGYAGIARLAAARSRHFAAHELSPWNINRALAILLFRAARWQS